MTLENLYYAVRSDERAKDPFTTTEIVNQYDKLYDKFVKPIQDYNEAEKSADEICAYEFMVEMQAFKVGFKTAVSLILSGADVI